MIGYGRVVRDGKLIEPPRIMPSAMRPAGRVPYLAGVGLF